MAPYNVPTDPEEQRIARIRQFGFTVQRAQSVAEQFTPEQVGTFTGFARMTPWLKPGVIRGLVQAGYNPDDAFSQWVAQRSAVADDMEGRTPGVAPGERKGPLRTLLGALPGAIADVQQSLPNKTAIGGFLDNPVETLQQNKKTNDEYIDLFLADPSVFGINDEEARDYVNRNRAGAIAAVRKVEGAQKGPIMAGVPGLRSVYSRVIKPTIRTAGMVAEFPLQEIQSTIRDAYGVASAVADDPSGLSSWNGYDDNPQADVGMFGEETNLGIAAEQGFDQLFNNGPGVDVGTGLFVDPDSAVTRIRRERELRHGNIGGHAVTGGRILADVVGLEPDTTPFNILSGAVDTSIAWFGDPTAAVQTGFAANRLASRTFQIEGVNKAQEAAGLVNGVRRFVDQPTAESWLARHTREVNRWRETTDAYEIDKASSFQFGPEFSQTLASAKTDDSVIKAFKSQVNRGKLRSTDQINGTLTSRMTQAIMPQWSRPRLLEQMPGKFIDYEDPRQVADHVRHQLVNVHAPEELVRTAYNDVARAKTQLARRGAVNRAYTDIGGVLEAHGIASPEVRALVTARRSANMSTMIDELVKAVGSTSPNADSLLMQDKLIQGLGPHISLRIMSRYDEAPDPRKLRRLTSSLRFLSAKDTAQYFDGPVADYMRKMPGVKLGRPEKVGELRLPFAAADHLMNDILKPSWLLRLAWPVRVIAEEQIRIANSPLDMDSMFNHPISFLSIAIHRKRKIGPIEIGGVQNIDFLGNPIDELASFKNAMFRGQGPWLKDPSASAKVNHVILNRNNDEDLIDYAYSRANHINDLHTNPISNYVANHPLEDSVDYFWRGGGKSQRRDLAQMDPTDVRYNTREGVRQWMEELQGNIQRITGNNTDLMEAVQTGTLPIKATVKGKPARIPLTIQDNYVNPEFRRALQNYTDDTAPEVISGVRFTTGHDKIRDGVLDTLFGFLMAAPTNKLSRSVVYKQTFWKQAPQLMAGGTRSAQKKILESAKEAGIKGQELAAIRAAASSAAPRGRMSADEINFLASGYALDETKNLLYDLTERRQWADIMRIMIPFGDAYQEIISRWSKLLVQTGGRPARRTQQIIQAAREPGSGILSGNEPGVGFFHENPFGEEVFTYPMSSALTQWITGAPVPLASFEGRVQGLNMIGTGLPGLGPAVQIPMAWIVDRYPEADAIREMFVPFGAPGVGEQSFTDWLNFGPAWARTAYQALTQGGNNKRLYANTVMNTAASLQASGDYGRSRSEQQRLMNDAADMARKLTAIRAFGQATLPASPGLEELINDSSGNTLSMGIITRQYYEWSDKHGYEEATRMFIESFGEDAIGAIIPKTVQTSYGAPRSIEQLKWQTDHPDLDSQFPSTFGFFGPQKGEFDYNTYIKTVVSGDRQVLTPEQWRRLMDDRLGDYYYADARAQIREDSPSQEQQVWLRGVSEALEEDFPFWRRRIGLPERPTSEQMVDELYEAVKVPTLRNTANGRAIRFYLEARDQAMAAVEQHNSTYGTTHPTFREADAFAPTREWLRGIASEIITDYPDFQPVWEIVFSREMSEDLAIREGFG